MSIDTIKKHMNEHHKEELIGLVKHYGGFDTKNVELVDVNSDGMKIKADDKEVFAPFSSKTDEKDYKDAIISLCSSISKKEEQIAQEVESFKDEFNTILLASMDSNDKPHISYSPLLKYDGNYYLYVSEVAQHYDNLKANPSAVQVMFIEDESKSKTIVARKRLTHDVCVEFLPRDDLFNKVYDSFENKVGKGGGISQIREMLDFHLVKLCFKDGRFVKGFGQAYDIDSNGKVHHVKGKGGMPHSMPHRHK